MLLVSIVNSKGVKRMRILMLYIIHIRYASLTKYKICHHSKQARTHRRWGILRLWDYSWPQLVTQMQTDYITRKSLFLLSFWVGSSSQKKAKRHSHHSFSCMSTLPHSLCILTFLVKKNREKTPTPSNTPFLSCCPLCPIYKDIQIQLSFSTLATFKLFS